MLYIGYHVLACVPAYAQCELLRDSKQNTLLQPKTSAERTLAFYVRQLQRCADKKHTPPISLLDLPPSYYPTTSYGQSQDPRLCYYPYPDYPFC